ncbi:MAG: aspartyl/asparaginyl beta-hydroxylase domain-containing protein [Coxiellaceae bacterium]|nr:aspartyl/asparaginyl beta-hydroxylase domain-containing protein [Coxiellaceae bacterium]
MNPAAQLLHEDFLDEHSIQNMLEKMKLSTWTPTVENGDYATDAWRVVKLIDQEKKTAAYADFCEMDKILKYFKCDIVNAVFYEIDPGAKLHPHRDLTGTLELGRLRFHIPLVTHPDVKFQAAGEWFHMKKNQLWSLNTSYKHALANDSDIKRVHIVIMVKVNDWVLQLLPRKNIRYYLHAILFYIYIAYTGFKTIFQPKKLKGRIKVFKHLYRIVTRSKIE